MQAAARISVVLGLAILWLQVGEAAHRGDIDLTVVRQLSEQSPKDAAHQVDGSSHRAAGVRSLKRRHPNKGRRNGEPN